MGVTSGSLAHSVTCFIY